MHQECPSTDQDSKQVTSWKCIRGLDTMYSAFVYIDASPVRNITQLTPHQHTGSKKAMQNNKDENPLNAHFATHAQTSVRHESSTTAKRRSGK